MSKLLRRIHPFWAWYDGWVGYFWDGKRRQLYICFPIPWLCWRIDCG